MKKPILIIGNKGDPTLENFYFKAFKNLGFSVDFFTIDYNVKNRIIAKIEVIFPALKNFFLVSKLIDYLRNNKKKYYFILIFKGIYLDDKSFLKIKSIKKSLWVNYFPDDPLNINDPSISNIKFLNVIKHFDIFCIWSKKIKKILEKKYKKNYFLYLPFAYDSLNKYKKNKKEKKYKKLITFIGTYDSNRSKIINSIKVDKCVYGGNWKRLKNINEKKTYFNGHVKSKGLVKVINSSLINLNILRHQNSTSHNMKTFEIPGYGGLMLTDRTKEQNEFFKENKSCYMYKGIFELNKKIDYIINNPKEASKVRINGHKKAREHNYINRAKFLVKTVDEFYRKKI